MWLRRSGDTYMLWKVGGALLLLATTAAFLPPASGWADDNDNDSTPTHDGEGTDGTRVCPFQRVDAAGLSREAFERQYRSKNIPVLIEGYGVLPSQTVSVAALKELAKALPLHVKVGTSGLIARESGKASEPIQLSQYPCSNPDVGYTVF